MKFSVITKTKSLSVFFTLIAGTVFGQSDLASPYTLFGPGLPNLRQTVSMAGVGGSGVALFDAYKMNISNPAVVAYHLDPIFESSAKSAFSTFNTNTGSFENKAFLLNNINLSFPIKRGVWGLTLGLIPLTTVGYEVVSVSEFDDLEYDLRSTYSGDGGINQGYIGTGIRVYNRVDSVGNVTSLAVGGNFNYNFGTVNSLRTNYFPDDTYSKGVKADESILIRDVNAEFGIHYQHNLIKRSLKNGRYLKLLLGATYGLGTDLNARLNEMVTTFPASSTSITQDTIQITQHKKGYVTMPNSFTIGVGLDYVSSQRARLRFSADYAVQNWSEYKTSFSDEGLSFQFQNSQRYSAGLEYTPELGSSNYLEVIEYRIGFKYEESNLNLRNTAINDVGMSFGLTLPLNHRRGISKSSISLSGMYGSSGTTDNGLIQEDYFRFYIGFSLTPHFRNRWFVQPKYD